MIINFTAKNILKYLKKLISKKFKIVDTLLLDYLLKKVYDANVMYLFEKQDYKEL